VNHLKLGHILPFQLLPSLWEAHVHNQIVERLELRIGDVFPGGLPNQDIAEVLELGEIHIGQVLRDEHKGAEGLIRLRDRLDAVDNVRHIRRDRRDHGREGRRHVFYTLAQHFNSIRGQPLNTPETERPTGRAAG